VAPPAAASEWGGIDPGTSVVDQVRERWGAPSREVREKVEGYDTLRWVYEGGQAPAGLIRMTVDFGLLTPAGYKPAVVRLLTLEPKPLIFGRTTVVGGWGVPDGVANAPDGSATLFWKEGLLVTFDKEHESATRMIFSLPQPDVPAPSAAPAAPAAPASPPAPAAPAAPKPAAPAAPPRPAAPTPRR
jgi:hypothetical protein